MIGIKHIRYVTRSFFPIYLHVRPFIKGLYCLCFIKAKACTACILIQYAEFKLCSGVSCFLGFLFFLAAPHGMWDLSFTIRSITNSDNKSMNSL